ncbi:MAG: imidazolonepropionase [Candidatus Marinimicrobia bacterium]|jgi:imidazolonepropionase|nr:imidazolonepropionase [Candidatus Neomarinimicrobiota bacterium]
MEYKHSIGEKIIFDLKTHLTNIGCLFTWDSQNKCVQTQIDGEILMEDGIILGIGSSTENGDVLIDCEQKLVTPGFVDSHTHPVFFHGREEEYSQRLSGMSYQEIAEKGGGIQSSINGVRNASIDELVEQVRLRMDRFLQNGTTTIEAKSGYGLSTESELKSLEVINRVSENHHIDIIPTFMGAHAFPPEYSGNHDSYVDLICDEMIPAVAEQGITKYCDVFCEKGYFDLDQTSKILSTGKEVGLIPRIHADEFQDSGAAELAAELDCVSADHLMAVSENGIRALAEKNVTGTLLPGTTFFLGSHQYAPARRMLDEGVFIALATDFNPGSSHIQSMPFMLVLACLYLHMSIEEALIASTWQGAVSLGVEDKVGSIEIGKQADIIIWDMEKPIDVVYSCPGAKIKHVFKKGYQIF